jgi:hypothetical protein
MIGTGLGMTSSVKVCSLVAAGFSLSETSMVTVYGPDPRRTVPPMTPVEVSSVRPSGRKPLVTVQV